MLSKFIEDRHPEMSPEAVKMVADTMDMSVVSLEYEKAIVNAVKNVMSGNIVRMLLIQVQVQLTHLLMYLSSLLLVQATCMMCS
jgi:ATP synthase regulation protein NCA2